MFSDDWIILPSAAALAFSVLSYVLLDGSDLGVGMLMGITGCARQRRAMALSILPIWDANETWLVLGGGGLLALFPTAYAILLPALYMPFIVMLLALLVRAMALEFRDQASSKGTKRAIDAVLSSGSLIVGVCQGAVLGALVQGISSENGQFSGSGLDWLSAFSLYCGAVLVVGYCWLGACWLYWRTEGELQIRAKKLAKALSVTTLLLLAILAVWTSGLATQYAERLSNLLFMSLAPVTMVVVSVAFFKSFRTRLQFLPLFIALGVFIAGFALMTATLYPLILPPYLTLQAAASGPSSQGFMLIGFALLMPVTLFYNTYGFRVFSGKIRPVEN